jgi:hypothetical protein
MGLNGERLGHCRPPNDASKLLACITPGGWVALVSQYHGYFVGNRMNPWSISPQSLDWISNFIRRKQLRRITECGSGASTVMLEQLARQYPAMTIVSLEHEDAWFKDTYRQLEAANYPTTALEFAPLGPIQLPLPPPPHTAQTDQWYGYRPRRRSPAVDLLLVDGPPGESRRFARLPAPYVIAVATGGYVILDDYERDEEQAIVRRWQADFGFELVETVTFTENRDDNTTLAVLYKPRWAWLKVRWRKVRQGWGGALKTGQRRSVG